MKNSSCTVSLHLKKKKSTHEFSCKVPNAFLHPVTVSTPGNIGISITFWGEVDTETAQKYQKLHF